MRLVEKLLPPACYSMHALQPTGIVIHFISARNIPGAERYDPEACWRIFERERVSAHYLVCREDEVWRLVPENRQAWHAGRSRFRGEDGLNRSWLGIEFIGDGETDYTEFQYVAGAWLVRDLMNRYGIPSNRIKGHEQVSGPRVRSDFKEDPGPSFDWVYFGHLVLRGLQ